MKIVAALLFSMILLIGCGGSDWSDEGRTAVMDACMDTLHHEEQYCRCVLVGLEEALTEDEVKEMLYSPGEIDMAFFSILGEITAECR